MNELDSNKFDRFLQVETRSVVVNGVFMPSLYQPYWLASKNIIGENDASSASVTIIARDICQFNIGDWLNFTCTSNRMQLLTRKAPYFPILHDVAEQIFQLGTDLQIISIGLNFIYSLGLGSEENYYNIGKNIGNLPNWEDILENVRLNSVSLRSQSDTNNSILNLAIQPTPEEMRISYGIDINVNNHFPLQKGNGKNVVEILNNLYNEYIQKSKETAIKTTNKFLCNE